MPLSPDVIKAAILDAFQEVPYPGDDLLVVDNSGRDPECREIATAFRGRDWRTVSLQTLRENAEALPLLSPSAFRYYLPAYMIGCAEAYYDLDVVPDSVVFHLTPPKERMGWEWEFFWSRVQDFTAAQRHAIRLFLELMEHYECCDWASEDMAPPEDGAKFAVEFWKQWL